MRSLKRRLSSLGMVNCLGSDKATIRDRLFAGDRSCFSRCADVVPERELWVGKVTDELPPIPPDCDDYASPTGRLLLAAYVQIRDEVEQAARRFGPERIGIVLGSSTSGIAVGEAAVRFRRTRGVFPAGYRYSAQEPGAAAELLARASGVQGPVYTVSTACSSSAQAFASASNLIALGVCDAVLVGGADALSGVTLNGFSVLELISDEPCDPMSRQRRGITIGEGAALFLMTADEGGVQLLGTGESCDAYHMSAPEPEGRGAELAMRRALKDAGLAARQITYINLHGTGTPANDSMESRAISRVFPAEVPCSSSKGQVGHTLGAAGAMETGFCWLALDGGGGSLPLPPHCWSRRLDPELAPLRLVERGDRAACGVGLTALLSNSFAFGGSNCSVIIGREEES